MAWVLVRAVFVSCQSRFRVLSVQMDVPCGEVCSSTPTTLSTAAVASYQMSVGAFAA